MSEYTCLSSAAVEVQGHRGNRQHVPENSIPSFISTLQMGADAIELDLLLTKDNIVVVHHNYRLNPLLCVNADGSAIKSVQLTAAEANHDVKADSELMTDIPLISQMTLAEVKQMDIGSKTLAQFPEQTPIAKLTVPTLEELFVAVNEHYARESQWEQELYRRTGTPISTRPLMRYNLEIKREWDRPDEVPPVELICSSVLDVVRRLNMESRVSYSSFDVDILRELRRQDASISLSVLYWHPDLELFPNKSDDMKEDTGTISPYVPCSHLQAVARLAKEVGASTVSPDQRLITSRADVDFLKSETNCRVVLWTINDAADWTRFLEYGVAGLITDFPGKLLKFLYERTSSEAVGPVSLEESISR